MHASFIGNLGHDGSSKDVNGTPVLEFSVAESIGYGDKKETQWIRCSLWGKRAEGRIKEFLRKGTQVYITGDVTLREYQKRDGTHGASLECRVADVRLIGKREASEEKPATAFEEQTTGFDDD